MKEPIARWRFKPSEPKAYSHAEPELLISIATKGIRNEAELPDFDEDFCRRYAEILLRERGLL